MRINFATAKNSRIPQFIGVNSTDDKFKQVVNEAQRRLVRSGLWWGTYQTYQIFLSSSGALTWPRQVAAIEAIAINDSPITVRDQWFQYLQTGWGIRSSTTSSDELQLIDQGTAVVFEDITDTDTYLRVYSDVAESASSRILIQGYDENGTYIRTLDGGEYVDGEYVTISTTPTQTTNKFTSVTGIIKPVTNGPVRLFKRDKDLIDTAIGYYEADETTPSYRRSIIPGLSQAPAYDQGSTSSPIISARKIDAVVKLDPIDVSGDNDWFVIHNLEALKMACKAVVLEEAENPSADAYWNKTLTVLRNELEHYEGHGAVKPLRIDGPDWGAAENVI